MNLPSFEVQACGQGNDSSRRGHPAQHVGHSSTSLAAVSKPRPSDPQAAKSRNLEPGGEKAWPEWLISCNQRRSEAPSVVAMPRYLGTEGESVARPAYSKIHCWNL